MKKRIVTYMNTIDSILEDKSPDTNYQELAKEHLIQLQFFMHERLVHLLVTLTFALLTMATFFLLYLDFHPILLLLLVVLLILLVPYVFHYFLLENSVQKMYHQYDEIHKCCEQQKNIPAN